MNLDPGIICYDHCQHGRLFGFKLPIKCDLCGKQLQQSPLMAPPVRVPFPFVRASQTACCIVIKPTKGDFLHDYSCSDDLHVGVTDSEGRVFEFDYEGVHTDHTRSWSQCLAVPLLQGPSYPGKMNQGTIGFFGTLGILSIEEEADPVWKEYWDFTLHSMAEEEGSWGEHRYDETKNNCYTFVISFLKALRPPGIALFDALDGVSVNTGSQLGGLTKQSFCSWYVSPRTAIAAKYISLYRKLLVSPCVAVWKNWKDEELGGWKEEKGNWEDKEYNCEQKQVIGQDFKYEIKKENLISSGDDKDAENQFDDYDEEGGITTTRC